MLPIIVLIPGIAAFPLAYIAVKNNEKKKAKLNQDKLNSLSTQHSPYASTFSIN
jgi:hypothetical protein